MNALLIILLISLSLSMIFGRVTSRNSESDPSQDIPFNNAMKPGPEGENNLHSFQEHAIKHTIARTHDKHKFNTVVGSPRTVSNDASVEPLISHLF